MTEKIATMIETTQSFSACGQAYSVQESIIRSKRSEASGVGLAEAGDPDIARRDADEIDFRDHGISPRRGPVGLQDPERT